jgi:hypothetical protein
MVLIELDIYGFIFLIGVKVPPSGFLAGDVEFLREGDVHPG